MRVRKILKETIQFDLMFSSKHVLFKLFLSLFGLMVENSKKCHQVLKYDKNERFQYFLSKKIPKLIETLNLGFE